MAKDLVSEFNERCDDLKSSLDEIESIEAVANKVNKLSGEQKKNFILLSKDAISDIKNNLKELGKLLKTTSAYVKDVDNVVKKIAKS